MTSSVRRALLAALLALPIALAPAGRAAAGPRWPDLTVGIGGTFAADGEPGNGGFQMSGAGMWPVDDALSFGVSAYAHDLGQRLSQFTEVGPPLVLLGTYESAHRFVYGAGWRLDYQPVTQKRWRPFGTASWQYARVQDDTRGTITNAESAASFGLGAGMRRDVLQHSTVGLVVRYHRLADDRVKQYMGATLEWGWRFATKTP